MKTFTVYRVISHGYEEFRDVIKDGLTEDEAREMVDDMNDYLKWELMNKEYFTYSESD
jgi:DNA-directed RNA polymerase subunit N (RpoN/RPB10)